jgi:hypothetical protein
MSTHRVTIPVEDVTRWDQAEGQAAHLLGLYCRWTDAEARERIEQFGTVVVTLRTEQPARGARRWDAVVTVDV